MAEVKDVLELELDEPNEFEIRDELRERRKGITEFEELVSFLEYVKDNCNCGYGAAPRSISQAAVATAWYFAHIFGITGFQAGFVMWDFIRDWYKTGNICGMKLVDYDDMLYPQYEDKFEKTISQDVWNALQKQAKQSLDEKTNNYYPYDVHPEVKAHWESIVEGNVPFGYVVEED